MCNGSRRFQGRELPAAGACCSPVGDTLLLNFSRSPLYRFRVHRDQRKYRRHPERQNGRLSAPAESGTGMPGHPDLINT
ncbi:hypothetical protein ASZ90_010842 [hydrocarbon metagenome]|uniref:Uncharacterized protein n=1 Tax=hydrocarbon metagenome TaxID=938273 RepID=A0A0W8FEY0_9ZZZZ